MRKFSRLLQSSASYKLGAEALAAPLRLSDSKPAGAGQKKMAVVRYQSIRSAALQASIGQAEKVERHRMCYASAWP